MYLDNPSPNLSAMNPIDIKASCGRERKKGGEKKRKKRVNKKKEGKKKEEMKEREEKKRDEQNEYVSTCTYLMCDCSSGLEHLEQQLHNAI